jgi:hypothetical protein
MSKPDWAERLQRTFSRKYEAGYAAGMADKDIEITAAYRIGMYLEQQRIIKLLEDEELHTHPNNLMKNYDELVWLGIKEQLIALIKGENK